MFDVNWMADMILSDPPIKAKAARRAEIEARLREIETQLKEDLTDLAKAQRLSDHQYHLFAQLGELATLDDPTQEAPSAP